jgi:hypothetical protein
MFVLYGLLCDGYDSFMDVVIYPTNHPTPWNTSLSCCLGSQEILHSKAHPTSIND